MKVAIHGGWLTAHDADGYCERFRIRLSAVTRYGYAPTDDLTIVWQTNTCGEEFKGNHVEALDRYFAEQESA